MIKHMFLNNVEIASGYIPLFEYPINSRTELYKTKRLELIPKIKNIEFILEFV